MSEPEQDQKNLPPSEKRRKEFRDRGEVAHSQELTALLASLGALLGLLLSDAWSQLTLMMRSLLQNLDHPSDVLFRQPFTVFVSVFLPIALLGLIFSLLATFAQLGWPPAFGKISIDLGRAFSLQGLSRLFSPKEALKRSLGPLASFVMVSLSAYIALKKSAPYFFSSRARDARTIAVVIGEVLLQLFLYAGSALLLIAVVSYCYQRRQIFNRMKMTTEEMKREHKEQEGDPLLKRQRQRRMRELSRGRMASVKTADVIVVNPTHFAVALRYQSGRDKAPKVLVKGVDAKAARIREIARKAGIPIVSQPPLARLLYKVAPEGKDIPANLYHAVAEILAYVYKLKKRAPVQKNSVRQKLPMKPILRRPQ
jgi:flagellar biosynthesis protein FlhB